MKKVVNVCLGVFMAVGVDIVWMQLGMPSGMLPGMLTERCAIQSVTAAEPEGCSGQFAKVAEETHDGKNDEKYQLDEYLSDECPSEDLFRIEEISEDSEVYQRIAGKSYWENEDISLEELRYVNILYYDFEHEVQEGELIVNQAIAEDCLDIFQQLYEAEYEIASVKLIDEYWTGDGNTTDTASVEANNTSAFCYRMTTSGKSLSNHALGCAIDINPRQNPYFDFSEGEAVWYHDGDEEYLDRTAEKEHMITEEDLCYQLFIEHGFTWGGSWNNPRDYQHFEKRVNSR